MPEDCVPKLFALGLSPYQISRESRKNWVGAQRGDCTERLGCCSRQEARVEVIDLPYVALPQLSPLKICLILTAVGSFYSSSRVQWVK